MYKKGKIKKNIVTLGMILYETKSFYNLENIQRLHKIYLGDFDPKTMAIAIFFSSCPNT